MSPRIGTHGAGSWPSWRRWKEALPDLEAALRAYSSSPELHETLAATYEHLGLPEIAAEHRRQAGSGKVAP